MVNRTIKHERFTPAKDFILRQLSIKIKNQKLLEIMKKLSLIALLVFMGLMGAQAAPINDSNDTIVINYGSKGQVIIVAKDAEALKELAKLDYNKLMQSVQSYADSARKKQNKSLEVDDSHLGAFRIEVSDRSDSGNVNVLFENEEGLISTSIRSREMDRRDTRNNNDRRDWDRDRRRRYRYGRTSSYLGLDLGLNTYLEDGNIPKNTDYELRPWGSRYVAIAWKWRTRIAKSVYFKYGLSVNWYNFMFNGNRRIVSDGTNTNFIIDNLDLEKTKLTVSYLNLPVMLQFGRNRSSLLRLGVGGYVGYRLGSYTKIKYGDNKQRDRDNYDLNPVRYGLAAELGFRRLDARFFVNYDMNTLFDGDSSLPELNPISFGIRF